MELLSQFLYSENIFSTVIGSHLENSRHFEKNQVANGFYQTSTLRGVPMPTVMLVPQSERFCLDSDLICRANWCPTRFNRNTTDVTREAQTA
jgi:hypothetical protein